MTCKEAADWLDAYIDGELDLTRQLELEQHANACAACAEALRRRRALQGAVRSAGLRFSPSPELEARVRAAVLDRPAPAEAPLAPAIPPWRGWWGGFASAAALATAAFLLIPYLGTLSGDRRLSEEVAAAHARSLMAGPLTQVEASDQHVVKPWFNGKVDFSPAVRDLASDGFPLEGGRLDHLAGRTVAALVYRRARHPITVFTWPSEATLALKETSLRGYHLVRWSSGGMAYWVISDVNAADLRRFAELLGT